MTARVLPRVRMGSDEAVHASVLSKLKFSVNASLCGRMFYDCKLAGLSLLPEQKLVIVIAENISHCDQNIYIPISCHWK